MTFLVQYCSSLPSFGCDKYFTSMYDPLQLEEATSSATPYCDHHRGGPLRFPGGRTDALRESQKRNNERFNGKRMLYVMKKKPFQFDFH
ncbi:hypothetical protein TNCV_2724921 [Trichonephila clavipes]|nr:hypothetical protein TNCV_2724921 [Trichonephila clavipes]